MVLDMLLMRHEPIWRRVLLGILGFAFLAGEIYATSAASLTDAGRVGIGVGTAAGVVLLYATLNWCILHLWPTPGKRDAGARRWRPWRWPVAWWRRRHARVALLTRLGVEIVAGNQILAETDGAMAGMRALAGLEHTNAWSGRVEALLATEAPEYLPTFQNDGDIFAPDRAVFVQYLTGRLASLGTIIAEMRGATSR